MGVLNSLGDTLSLVEVDLQNALIAFLNGWKGTSPPTLKDASSPEVQECLNSIFINGHGSLESLRHWIDRRCVGTAFATRMVADQWTLCIREDGGDEDDEDNEEEISAEELIAMQKRLQ